MQYCDFITQIAYNHPKTTATTSSEKKLKNKKKKNSQNGNARCNGLEVGVQGVALGSSQPAASMSGGKWKSRSQSRRRGIGAAAALTAPRVAHFAWEWHKNHISVLLFAVNENANKIGFSVPYKKSAK